MLTGTAKRTQKILTLPSLIWLLSFFLLPTLFLINFSFKPSDAYGGIEPGWTLDTLINILSTPYYLKLLVRTIILSSLTTAICLLLAIPFSYTISQSSNRIKRLALLAIAIPFWTNFLVRIFAWKTILHPEGTLKTLLVFFHLCSEETILLYNAYAIILVMVYTFLPFAIFPIYTACERFDFRLIEAAQDLGASRIKALYSIFLPGIWQGILGAGIMIFIPALGSYVVPDIIGGTNAEMIGSKIAQRTFTDRNLPAASALSTLLCIAAVFIVILPIALKYLFKRHKESA